MTRSKTRAETRTVEPDTRLVLGAMTGTSLDALDAALVSIAGRGRQMHARVLRSLSRPLEDERGDLNATLRAAAEGEPLTAAAYADLALRLGQVHADALSELAAGDRVHLAGVHGQTLFHRPPLSLQLLEPAPIAAELGCPVWFSPRQSDLAAGGQGAPITPAADQVLYAGADESRAVVNLGGFCNVTILQPGADPRGFDLCACNQLLDALARDRLGEPYDQDGASALSGKSDTGAVDRLTELLRAQRAESRSLGSGDELADQATHILGALTIADALRSAAEALAKIIAEACDTDRVLLAGGGARNAALRNAIASKSKAPVHDAGDCGPPGDVREAAAMAVLAALAADGEKITYPGVTGRAEHNAPDGCWTGITEL